MAHQNEDVTSIPLDIATHLGGLQSGAALGAFIPRRVSEPASGPGSSPEPQESDSSRFKLAGAAMACQMLPGFGFVRRVRGPAASQGEIIQLELIRLGKENRACL